MAKKNRTKQGSKVSEKKLKEPSIVFLTKDVEEIKERYAYLGLKNLLSAGLVLFHFACDKQKMDALDEANGWIEVNE